jgi:hypothetical protein
MCVCVCVCVCEYLYLDENCRGIVTVLVSARRSVNGIEWSGRCLEVAWKLLGSCLEDTVALIVVLNAMHWTKNN